MSYAESDIPEFFYLGCYFSEDFVRPPVDKDAVVSLRGVEGISANLSTAQSFNKGALVAMPGKALTKVTKLSRGMYKNPHYQASAGFRAPRRFKSGSSPLTKGKKIDHDQVAKEVIGHVLAQISNFIPNISHGYSSIKAADGTTITTDMLVNKMKQTGQVRIKGDKILPHPNPWDRPQHKENRLKTVRSADDFGKRLFSILKPMLGSEYFVEYDETDEDTTGTHTYRRKSGPFPNEEEAKAWIQQEEQSKTEDAEPKKSNFTIVKKSLADKLMLPSHASDERARKTFKVVSKNGEVISKDLDRKDADEMAAKYPGSSVKLHSKAYRVLASNGEVVASDVSRREASRIRLKHKDAKIEKQGGDKETVSVPHILQWVRQSALSAGDFSSEAEWTLKRVPLDAGTYVKACPHCGTKNPINRHETGKEIRCRNCGQTFNYDVCGDNTQFCYRYNGLLFGPFPSEESANDWKKGREEAGWTGQFSLVKPEHGQLHRGALPVLNIPKGSYLFINTNHGFPAWGNKYIPKDVAGMSDEAKFKELIKATKLYNRFNVHLNLDDPGNKIQQRTRSFDPERGDQVAAISGAIKSLVDRDRPVYLNLLKKVMAAKGIPEGKVDEILARWKAAKFIDIQDGKIKLLQQDLDEDVMTVMDFLKGAEGASVRELEQKIGIDEESAKKALDKLMGQGKVQLLNNGKYDIKLSDEEMGQVSELEQKVLEYINKNHVGNYYDVHIPGVYAEDVKKAVRMLTLKKKIFRSVFSGRFRQVVSPDEPLDKAETAVLNYLKKWPHSDMFTLSKVFKTKFDVIKALDGLIARDLVMADANKNITLNKSKVTDFNADHKPHSRVTEATLQILGNHFYTRNREISNLKKWDTYEYENVFNKIRSSGAITTDTYGRLIPADASYLKPMTIEEKMVLKMAEKKPYFKAENASNYIGKKQHGYSSIYHLLKYMVANGKLKSAYHPTDDETVYHAADKEFVFDSSKYDKNIAKIIEDKKRPLDEDDIRRGYNDEFDYISEAAIEYLLKRMVEKGLLKMEKDFLDHNKYYLPNMEGPKPVEFYYPMILEFLKAKGPTSQSNIAQHMQDNGGLDFEGTWAVIAKMTELPEGDPNKVAHTYSNILQDDVYHLPGAKIPSWADHSDVVLQIVAEEPANYNKITDKLREKGIEVSSNSVYGYLEELETEGKIARSKPFGGSSYYKSSYVWHLPDVDPHKQEKIKIADTILKTIEGYDDKTVSGQDLAYNLSNNYNINASALLQVLKQLIQEKKLHIKEGDIEGAEPWDVVLTLNPVDPSEYVKIPGWQKASAHVLAHLKQLGGTAQAAELGNNLYYAGIVKGWGKVKAIMDELYATKQVHKIPPYVNDEYDYWTQQVSLTPHVEPTAQPAHPAAPVPHPAAAAQPTTTTSTETF